MWRLVFLALLLLAGAAGACPSDRVLTVVVPYAAGGSMDATTRVLSHAVASRLERPVVIRNVPGASGALGVKEVLAAPADGCTVLAGAINTVVLVPLLNPKAGFSARHVRPLAKVGSTEVVLVAAADFPASNLVELAELARGRGTALSAGHPGNETVQALALAMLGKRTTSPLVPVPYNGAARLVTDLLGGHLDVAVVAMPVAAPLLKQGRLKVLERLSKRNGFDLDSWSGWFVPAAVPAGATQELTDALLAAMDDEDVQRALLMLGAPAPPWPEQRRFARDIQRTALAYAELVRQTGHTGN